MYDKKLTDFEPNRVGDIAEMKACVWLFERGYEVFRNYGCTGAIDMIAIKDDKVVKVDVKSIVITKRGTKRGAWFACKRTRQEAYEAGITFLYVSEDQVGWNRDYFDLSKHEL